MTADPWRALTLDAAARWLAGAPDALERARQLADDAQDARQAAEVVTALLDTIGAAIGTTAGVKRARSRIDARAARAADELLGAAVDEGNYRSREGR